MKKETLTVIETAAILGLGKNGAYEGIRKGQIPAIRVGKRLLVPRVALERLLADAGRKAASA